MLISNDVVIDSNNLVDEEDKDGLFSSMKIEDLIQKFRSMHKDKGVEGIMKRQSGIPLTALKKIADYLGMTKSQPKKTWYNL